MIFTAYYLHRLDPVIFKLTDWLQIRWYGLAYVAAFIAGFYLLRWWARRGIGELKESQVADFMTYAALFGVLLGGRLGYMLFYDAKNFFANPISFFYVTGGGMSSHGGIAGLFFFTLYWSRTRKQSWTGLGDNLVVASPLGFLFGRIANFINGELYGRATDVSWAMKFPDEATSWQQTGDPRWDVLEKMLENRVPDDASVPESITHLARTDDAFAAQLSELLTPRHPSQLYAAVLEGLLLFVILFIVREKWPRAPHGMLTALFFLLYAVFRFTGEFFREPAGYIMGLTEGQFYSVFLLVPGLAFLVFALSQSKRVHRSPA